MFETAKTVLHLLGSGVEYSRTLSGVTLLLLLSLSRELLQKVTLRSYAVELLWSYSHILKDRVTSRATGEIGVTILAHGYPLDN